MNFSDAQKSQIRQAILAAEKKTSGEVVPVIVKHADSYPSAHFRWALIGSFVALILCYWIESQDTIWFLYSFLIGSFVGHSVAYIPALKRLVLTKDQINEEFHQRALESFVVNGVTETANRAGVQIFISALEHKAMILADVGIQQRVEKDQWQKVLGPMLPKMKQAQYTEALVGAIEEVGELLAKHFPRDSEATDELPNKLIIDL